MKITKIIALHLLLLLTVGAFGQSAALSDRDAELARRRAAAPSERNQTSLKDTLKWLAHEGGTADGGRNHLTGLETYGVKFSSCKLSYLVSPAEPNSHSRVSPAIAPLYITTITKHTVRLVDLDPDSLNVETAGGVSYLKFATVGAANKIHLEWSGGLQFHVPGRDPESEKWKNEGRLEIRERRIAPEYANAFSYAIGLCRDQK